MIAARTLTGLVLLGLAAAACTREARELGPSVPQTRPAGAGDPRIPAYRDNAFQISQGGRYFAWYGCSGCHGDTGPAVLNLADTSWRHGRGFDQVFASIADRHGRLSYGTRVPVEQLWQLSAYVTDLPQHTPDKRRRNSLDQSAEPVAGNWSGPLE